MKHLNKFRICNALEIRENGDKIPAFSIQRKNILGVWTNVKLNYYQNPYSNKNYTLSFSTIEEAQKEIYLMIEQIKSKNIIYSKKKVIHQDFAGTSQVRMLKTVRKFENGRFVREFIIQTRKVYTPWSDVRQGFFQHSSDNFIIKDSTYRDSLFNYNRVIDKIETTNTKTVSSSFINL